ncbi:MAG: hypothetical protein K6T90_22415 [Leptolyngbyaceae cyanobacterium HOT.MB2.61]|jgi:hypothetical protein|nr:hypothetical protein [Leptolyngbyaceae cyanobacterium HOT.MB2.61]
MKRLLIGIAGLVGLTISSCAISILATALPKELIQQTVACPTDGKAKTENFQVLSTHRWSQGIVILFSGLCPGEGKTAMKRIIGHKVIKWSGMGWQISSSDSYVLKNTPSKPEKLVNYKVSRSSNLNGDRYTVLYGQALKPKVATIEATFNNGQILRDRSSDGAFVLIATGATGVCEVRILGSDNQILRQEEPVIPKQIIRDGNTHWCLPVSYQL